jgi:SNF2 family DNA or RNA helicase
MDILVSTKHKSLGVPLRPDVRNLFPDAKEVTLGGNAHIVLPHGLTETFILRKIGFDVPSPMESNYDWAGGTPFDVQRKTCSMLTLNQRAYVLNDMGTGKTKSALWAWDYLYKDNICNKLLVVAPLSTLTFTWAREVFNTLPHRKCVVLHGARERRLERLKDPGADIFIVNHDGLKTIQPEVDAMVKAGVIDVMVLDELAIYRNGKAARTAAMRKFAPSVRWVWGMTGSPIPHAPTDAWAQAQIVTPRTVPKYFTHYRNQLMRQLTQFKWVPKHDAAVRAFEALQPAVRYTLEDVVELPECIERYVDIELGPTQENIYKVLSAKCYALIQNNEITAANAGAVMMKLLQVSLGWVYGSNGQTVSLDNDKRLDALIDVINSTSRKVLVFSPFKHALSGISEVLTKEGIDHATVSGDTPATERANVFNLFQNTGKYKVINAHPQCLAHGITLTAADTVVWFGPVMSLEIYEQANRRIRRVGQAHKQQVLHFQSTAVERKIYKILKDHQDVQDKLLELFEESSK